jgi:hypothetical protein
MAARRKMGIAAWAAASARTLPSAGHDQFAEVRFFVVALTRHIAYATSGLTNCLAASPQRIDAPRPSASRR